MSGPRFPQRYVLWEDFRERYAKAGKSEEQATKDYSDYPRVPTEFEEFLSPADQRNLVLVNRDAYETGISEECILCREYMNVKAPMTRFSRHLLTYKNWFLQHTTVKQQIQDSAGNIVKTIYEQNPASLQTSIVALKQGQNDARFSPQEQAAYVSDQNFFIPTRDFVKSADEAMFPEDKQVATLPCLHAFHRGCILQAKGENTRFKCPTCKFWIEADFSTLLGANAILRIDQKIQVRLQEGSPLLRTSGVVEAIQEWVDVPYTLYQEMNYSTRKSLEFVVAVKFYNYFRNTPNSPGVDNQDNATKMLNVLFTLFYNIPSGFDPTASETTKLSAQLVASLFLPYVRVDDTTEFKFYDDTLTALQQLNLSEIELETTVLQQLALVCYYKILLVDVLNAPGMASTVQYDTIQVDLFPFYIKFLSHEMKIFPEDTIGYLTDSMIVDYYRVLIKFKKQIQRNLNPQQLNNLVLQLRAVLADKVSKWASQSRFQYNEIIRAIADNDNLFPALLQFKASRMILQIAIEKENSSLLAYCLSQQSIDSRPDFLYFDGRHFFTEQLYKKDFGMLSLRVAEEDHLNLLRKLAMKYNTIPGYYGYSIDNMFELDAGDKYVQEDIPFLRFLLQEKSISNKKVMENFFDILLSKSTLFPVFQTFSDEELSELLDYYKPIFRETSRFRELFTLFQRIVPELTGEYAEPLATKTATRFINPETEFYFLVYIDNVAQIKTFSEGIMYPNNNEYETVLKKPFVRNTFSLAKSPDMVTALITMKDFIQTHNPNPYNSNPYLFRNNEDQSEIAVKYVVANKIPLFLAAIKVPALNTNRTTSTNYLTFWTLLQLFSLEDDPEYIERVQQCIPLVFANMHLYRLNTVGLHEIMKELENKADYYTRAFKRTLKFLYSKLEFKSVFQDNVTTAFPFLNPSPNPLIPQIEQAELAGGKEDMSADLLHYLTGVQYKHGWNRKAFANYVRSLPFEKQLHIRAKSHALSTFQ